MLGDLDMLACAQKDAPTMRRLSVELGNSQHGHAAAASGGGGGRDIPGGAGLRRLSTSSVASSTGRSSMSTDSASISPTFSSSLPNSFYLERVSSLLGRASSLPLDRGGAPPSPASAAPSLPTIPASARSPGARPLAGPLASDPTATRVSGLLRSLSKGMNNFN